MYCSKYRPYRAVEYKPADRIFRITTGVIFRTRIMPVWRVNFNNMPKICRTTFCTKED